LNASQTTSEILVGHPSHERIGTHKTNASHTRRETQEVGASHLPVETQVPNAYGGRVF